MPTHNKVLSIKQEDIDFLTTFIKKGTHKAREIKRARVLLLLHRGKNILSVATDTEYSKKSIERIITRYITGGLARALYDAPRSGQPKKLTDKEEAYIVALACTKAPQGSLYWTLDLLQEAFIKKKKKDIGRSAIWIRLTTRSIKPWREKNVVHTEGR